MAVNIDVNLEKIETSDIAAVKAQLKSLDEDIDIDFDFDDIISGAFEDLDIEIDADNINIKNLDQLIDGLGSGSGSSSGSGSDNLIGPDRINIDNNIGRLIRDSDALNLDLPDPSSGLDIGKPRDERTGPISLPSYHDKMPEITGKNLKKSPEGLLQANLWREMTQRATDLDIEKGKLGRMKRNADKLANSGKGLRRVFSKLRPSFRKIYAIVALALPAVAGLAAQLGAVVVSLGALAVAGGAIGVLGMLGGQADTLAGSMANAENRIKNFKQELFQAVEPAADLLAPIAGRLMDTAIAQVSSLTDELAGLGSFGGFYNFAIESFGSGIERLLQIINELQPEIEAVARPIVTLISTRLPEFFAGVIKEAAKVGPTLGKVGNALFQMSRLIYMVLKSLMDFFAALCILSPIISTVADILGNKWVRSMIVLAGAIASIVGTMILFGKIMGFMVPLFMALNGQLALQGGLLSAIGALWSGSWLAGAATQIYTLISGVWTLNGALGVTAKLLTAIVGIATLGAGLAVAAGALSQIGDMLSPSISGGGSIGGQSSGVGGSSGTNDVTMNFYGDMDQQSKEKMVDVSKQVHGQNSLQDGNFGMMN